MSDSDDPNSIFEINDFTIVTPLEELSASFENLIQKWELYDRRPVKKEGCYHVATKDIATVKFGENKLKFEFKTPLYNPNLPYLTDNSAKKTARSQSEASNSEFDEDTELVETLPFGVVEEISNNKQTFEHFTGITTEFGIREYILVTPFDENNDMITSESQANSILGALKASIFSNRCEVPVIVAVKENAQNLFHGYASDGTVFYNFSTATLRNFNRGHFHLYGLLRIFKEEMVRRKIRAMNYVSALQGGGPKPLDDDIRITTRFHYYFPVKYSTYHHVHSEDSLKVMPLGTTNLLPIDSFTVISNWKSFREDALTETDTHSDFNINHANNWAVTANTIDVADQKGALEKVLRTFLGESSDRIKEMHVKAALGKYLVEPGVGNALDKLSITETSQVRIGAGQHSDDTTGIIGPLPPDLVSAWIDEIYGVPNENLQHELSLIQQNQLKQIERNGSEYSKNCSTLKELLYDEPMSSIIAETVNNWSFKAAPENSLIDRMAIAMSNVQNLNNGNARSEPQLWLAFVTRLREKYEANENVDIDAEPGHVDLSHCLLQQKIQLLQACIVARRKRHALLENNDSIMDEFYDAEDSFEKQEERRSSIESSAQGRLHRLGNNKLMGSPDVPLYVPITQDRSPMTEDMLEKHTEYLCSLSDEDRRLAQLEPLRSDMMSFKAANPDCDLVDFLRWHSPKDVDESNSLSERMKVPNNTWLQCWENTEPVAVINQARLFNDTKIAEEVLEMLENARVEQIREWLKPVVFANAFIRLTISMRTGVAQNPQTMNEVKENMEHIADKLRSATMNGKKKDYEEVMRWMGRMEKRIMIENNLLQLIRTAQPRFPEFAYLEDRTVNEFIRSIVHQTASHEDVSSGEPAVPNEVTVLPQHPVGRILAAVCEFDKSSEDRMKKPERKEYIISWITDRPSECGINLPQRMYASLEKDFNQLCFSLGQDCQFKKTEMP